MLATRIPVCRKVKIADKGCRHFLVFHDTTLWNKVLKVRLDMFWI